MKFNPRLMSLLDRCANCRKSPLPVTTDGIEKSDEKVTFEEKPPLQIETNLTIPMEPTKQAIIDPMRVRTASISSSGSGTGANRRMSAMSAQSMNSADGGPRSLFRHHKHGELSSNFRTKQDHVLLPAMEMEGDDGGEVPPTDAAEGAEGVPNGAAPTDVTSPTKSQDIALQSPVDSLKRDLAAEPIPEESAEEENQDAAGAAEDEEEESPKMHPCPCLPPVSAAYPSRKKTGFTAWVRYILRWILFIFSFPFVCAYTWTIPDCSKEHNRKWFWLSFLMSVLWIAVISFALVTVVGRSGCLLKIDTYTMGLVVISVGTSVPDCISSILVARDGFGDMAVSNAIGSNVFDINLGLGLPFLIRMAIDKGKAIRLLSDEEMEKLATGQMLIPPHVKFGFILLLILFIVQAVFMLMKYRLTKFTSLSFVGLYLVFTSYALIQELHCKGSC
ncbi:PREDICTED: sodium/potassium/calcium exchanger 3-like [Priapulus caudatus]|uniref:Sodium/potassium/calcium exchanger 3-like n=1 Tax=Priapulus caudatus TaxID=37621 RepID=A0ABM1E190_PRICU|nr:PREDICTED: sodium/potassium/calcium exchanger 3-like [Priapulus caudatus]